jgi:hypothetical protein
MFTTVENGLKSSARGFLGKPSFGQRWALLASVDAGIVNRGQGKREPWEKLQIRIPKGFCPEAQGCEERETLDKPFKILQTPTQLRRLFQSQMSLSGFGGQHWGKKGGKST